MKTLLGTIALALIANVSVAAPHGETILKGMTVSKVSYAGKENRVRVVIREPRQPVVIVEPINPIPMPTPRPLAPGEQVSGPGQEYEFVLDPANATDANYLNLFLSNSGWGSYNVTIDAAGVLAGVERGGGWSSTVSVSNDPK